MLSILLKNLSEGCNINKTVFHVDMYIHLFYSSVATSDLVILLGLYLNYNQFWSSLYSISLRIHSTSDYKQILHATVLVYYYPRNITIPRVVINLISNTVKVQYLFYYPHCTLAYKIVSGL